LFCGFSLLVVVGGLVWAVARLFLIGETLAGSKDPADTIRGYVGK
jgi:hypothetical protein